MNSDRVLFSLFSRFLSSAGAAVGAAVLVFFLIHMIPGDPVDNLLGEQAAMVDRQAMRKALGLDLPIHEQFERFVLSIADFSLGRSFVHPDRTVASLIAEVFPYTLQLALSSILFALLIAIPLGMTAALRRGTFADTAAMSVAVLGISLPNVWLGPLLVYAFVIVWPLAPPPGLPDATGALVLPTITLGSALMASSARVTRSAFMDVLDSGYILAARARGLPLWRILLVHALRNAAIPVMTVAGMQFGSLLGGAVVTEKIFARPGLGTLLLNAIFQRDYPVVQGVVLTSALLVVTVNLLVDLAYMAADPRLRR